MTEQTANVSPPIGRLLRLVAIGEAGSLRAALRLAGPGAGVELVAEGDAQEGPDLVARVDSDVVVVEATSESAVVRATALAERRQPPPGVVIVGATGRMQMQPSAGVALLPASASLADVLLAAGRVGWRPGPTAPAMPPAPEETLAVGPGVEPGAEPTPSLLDRLRAAERALYELRGILEPGGALRGRGPAPTKVRLRGFRSFRAVMLVLERVAALDAVSSVRAGAAAAGVVEFEVDGPDVASLEAALVASGASLASVITDDGTLEVGPGADWGAGS